MPRWPVVLFSILLAGCGPLAPRCRAPTAEGLVQAVDARRVLRELLNRTLMGTETAPMILAHNPAAFAQTLPGALDAAVDRFGPAWEANLLIAYRESLSPAALGQACDAFNRGDAAGYARLTDAVGRRQRDLSTRLVTDATTDVLNRLMPLLR